MEGGSCSSPFVADSSVALDGHDSDLGMGGTESVAERGLRSASSVGSERCCWVGGGSTRTKGAFRLGRRESAREAGGRGSTDDGRGEWPGIVES